MMMNDEQFRQAHQPLPVPAHFEDAADHQAQVVYALAQLDEATADEVVQKLQELSAGQQDKDAIAHTHQILADYYHNGQISANEVDGELKFNLHKITRANTGRVDPEKLAPGLD